METILEREGVGVFENVFGAVFGFGMAVICWFIVVVVLLLIFTDIGKE